MTAILVAGAIVVGLAFRSDTVRGIFYDPTDGVSVGAILLAIILFVIFEEVASEAGVANASDNTIVKVEPVEDAPKGTPKESTNGSSTNGSSTNGSNGTNGSSAKSIPTPIASSTASVVQIPPGADTIEPRAFFGSKTLKSVDIPSSVKEIGKEAFGHCQQLTSVTIHEGLHTIGVGAFQGCTSLKSIKLPSTLKVVDELAFCDCCQLESVDIAPGLQTMGQNSFRNCAQLKAIELPSGCSLKFSSE